MPDPRPTGTATFLFTDVEGSTALWEHHATWMAGAHARHEHLLRTAIAAHGGQVHQQIGDAFQAVFASAEAALAAAVAAQRALHHEWTGDSGQGTGGDLTQHAIRNTQLAIRVRMAIATGEADEPNGDHSSPLLRRLDALLPAGNGGQILLSAATADVVRAGLPPGVWLRDLGERQLPHQTAPEHVWQAVVPQAGNQFRPLRLTPGRPHNLPRQLTSFIGREREAAEVAALLRQPGTRLVTLTGPGGTGKTRLALRVAADLLDEYPDGVWFVDLSALVDPALVLSTIATTLGISEQGRIPIAQTLATVLATQRRLLVLDNFEQLLPAAPALGRLVEATRHPRLLVSSRAPLGLAGETAFSVPPLPVPDPAHLPPWPQLGANEAIQLFVVRGQARAPALALDPTTAPAVAEICARVDGLPLAIELAATRVAELGLEAVRAGLEDKLNLLAGRLRGRTARQQTLRGAIAWSYDLLPAGARQLFGRMAVFQGGGTLAALNAVCNRGAIQLDMLDGVQVLLANSLLQQRAGRDGVPRFGMLETIHEYARERLQESGQAEELARAHAAYFLTLAEEAVPHLVGEDPRLWFDRLEDEHDNLRGAVSWTVERVRWDPDGEAGETALHLVAALEWFWRPRGYFSEAQMRIEAALSATAASSRSRTRARAGALNALANICVPMQEFAPGRAAAEEALIIARELGDTPSSAGALFILGATIWSLGDRTGGNALLEESVALSRQSGDAYNTAMGLANLGLTAYEVGDLDQARRLLEEGLGFARRAKSKSGIALAQMNLGEVALQQGDYAIARSHLETALSAYRDIGHKYRVVICLKVLVALELMIGNYSEARAAVDEALALAGEMGLDGIVATDLQPWEGLVALGQGDAVRAGSLIRASLQTRLAAQTPISAGAEMAQWLVWSAAAASATGDPQGAARLLSAANRIQTASGVRWWPFNLVVFERALQAARSQLSAAAFQAAWDEGAALSTEQAIQQALADPLSRPS